MAWWLLLSWWACTAPPPVQVATLNIETFPRSDAQVEGAVATVAGLGVPLVAVQEIRDPERLRREVKRQLGSAWRYVTHDDRRGALRVGLLYDGARYRLEHVFVHESVRVTPGGRPALDVRLSDRGNTVRVFVVHLKAGRGSLDTRRRQLDALTTVVQAARRSNDRVVVLGDFNSVLAADRVRLAAFAADVDLPWVSHDVTCTAVRPEGDGCAGVALDHVFGLLPKARAGGPCAEACRWEGACPPYARTVSDHCPVVAR